MMTGIKNTNKHKLLILQGFRFTFYLLGQCRHADGEAQARLVSTCDWCAVPSKVFGITANRLTRPEKASGSLLGDKGIAQSSFRASCLARLRRQERPNSSA